MQFLRTTTKQEAVEADTPEQAQTAEGKSIDITVRVSPRPTAASQVQRPLNSPALAARQTPQAQA